MYLSFDLGGTNIKAGIIASDGNILKKETLPTDVASGVEGILKQFLKLKETLLFKTGIKEKDLIGVGIGIPGFICEEKGIITKAPNLGWKDIPLKKLEKTFSLPTFITNDANAAALGEMWQGAGKNKKNLLLITVGTGIGAGVIVAGKLLNGEKGLAGEIGHFCVKPDLGRTCSCGKKGCLETEFSGKAFKYYGEKALSEGKKTALSKVKNLSARDIVEKAIEGDKVALEIIDKGAYYFGLALSNIYLINAPEKILLGGGLINGNIIVEAIKKWFNFFALENVKAEEIILKAQLGNDAGIIGLAKLVQIRSV